jgi:uncharacterized membrane protein YqjE
MEARFRNPAGRAGFFDNLLALINALASFFESRAALFAKESKAAVVQLVALVALIVAALLLFAFGYIFLVATAVVSVAGIAQVPWVWVALIAAGAHIVLALVCLLIARGIISKAPYRETAAELKKDREWLKNLDETSRPTN